MEKSQRVKLTVLVAFVALLLLNGTGGSEQQIAANMARVRHWYALRHELSGYEGHQARQAGVVRCVKKGSKYGLWVDHHVYELEPQSKAVQYAAKDVSVTGWLDGETIHITSIKASDPATTEKSESNYVGQSVS